MDRVHGPGPWTGSMDRVHGPGPRGGPWTRSMGWSMDPGPCFVYVQLNGHCLPTFFLNYFLAENVFFSLVYGEVFTKIRTRKHFRRRSPYKHITRVGL